MCIFVSYKNKETMTIQDYNKLNPLKDTKIATLGKDTYTLEIRNNYHILINGRLDKTYKRLPADLKEWFGI